MGEPGGRVAIIGNEVEEGAVWVSGVCGVGWGVSFVSGRPCVWRRAGQCVTRGNRAGRTQRTPTSTCPPSPLKKGGSEREWGDLLSLPDPPRHPRPQGGVWAGLDLSSPCRNRP